MTNFMGLTQDEQEAYYAKHPPKKQVGCCQQAVTFPLCASVSVHVCACVYMRVCLLFVWVGSSPCALHLGNCNSLNHGGATWHDLLDGAHSG
jgi:hypothetical protein